MLQLPHPRTLFSSVRPRRSHDLQLCKSILTVSSGLSNLSVQSTNWIAFSMTRTHAQNEVPAPRRRSKETSQAIVGDKCLGRPASTGTRKRVNIDSLASRLGPEVVGELEALVIPGSREMPSFTARQAIQKRYNVNRRHIYDWYHTKGLRVTKEDARLAAASTPVRPQVMLNAWF